MKNDNDFPETGQDNNDDKSNPLAAAAMEKGAVPDGYREVDIKFFQFKVPGDTLTGRLTAKSTITLKRGQEVGKYSLFNPENGSRFTFLGSSHLDDLMKAVTIGQNIMVVYVNDEILENQFTMKKYKVYIKTQN